MNKYSYVQSLFLWIINAIDKVVYKSNYMPFVSITIVNKRKVLLSFIFAKRIDMQSVFYLEFIFERV